MTGPGPLRAELHGLADEVTATDLYDRSLARSRRLGRREALIGTAAALAALGLLGSGLWRLPGPGATTPAPAAAAPSATVAPAAAVPVPAGALVERSATERASRPDRPRPATTTTTPRWTSLSDLPGQVFYAATGPAGRLVRLAGPDGPQTVLTLPDARPGISPDGSRVAYVSEGRLMVVPTGGGDPQQAYAGTASAEQAPVWSPDGDRLLIDAAEPGVLDVATGTLTPLSHGLAGQDYRWSGDGSTLVYATTDCGLEVADPAAQSGTPVPTATSPAGKAGCRPVSVDATGDLVTVRLEQAEAGPADAVVDTVTGDLVDLPVSGRIIGAVFDAGGNLLVRSVQDDRRRLSLFAPDFTLLLRAREPASLKDLDLLAYTR